MVQPENSKLDVGLDPLPEEPAVLSVAVSIRPSEIGQLGAAVLRNAPRADISALASLETELNTPGSEANDALVKNREKTWYSPGIEGHLQLLADLGHAASFHAGRDPSQVGVVYYPYGGADPHSAFSVFGSARDVFALGIESFGSPGDFQTYLKSGSGYDKAGASYTGFDSIRDLKMTMMDNGVSGISTAAISRIQAVLGGRIEAVNYFELESDGSLRFVEPDKAREPSSGVITFSVPGAEPGERIEKRYWYLSANVYSGMFMPQGVSSEFGSIERAERFGSLLEGNGFTDENGLYTEKIVTERARLLGMIEKSVGRDSEAALRIYDGMLSGYERSEALKKLFGELECHAMLIKAANNMWDPNDDSRGLDGYGLAALAHRSLEPARRSDAVVITDNPTNGSGGTHGYNPHPFWKVQPHYLQLQEGQSFGYNRGPGDPVYVGTGGSLREGI